MNLEQFGDESSDIVHAHQVLLHVLNPLKGLQEMRRVAKTGDIVSTSDGTRQILFPPTRILEKQFEIFYAFLRLQGADPRFAERNHTVAHEASFEWDQIEMSSIASEYSGTERRQAWVEGVKNSVRVPMLQGLLLQSTSKVARCSVHHHDRHLAL